MSNWKFNKREYDKHDQKSKKTAVEFLEGWGYKLETPLSEQGEMLTSGDFIMIGPLDGKFIIEVEHKTPWVAFGEWQSQFPSIDIPYRKKTTFANMIKNYGDNSMYIMFNRDYDTLLVLDIADIVDSKTYRKNTYGSKMEEFYMVNPTLANIYVYNGKHWR